MLRLYRKNMLRAETQGRGVRDTFSAAFFSARQRLWVNIFWLGSERISRGDWADIMGVWSKVEPILRRRSW